MKRNVAIIDGARTGFTKIGSSLKRLSSVDLGVKPVNALASRYSLQNNPDGLLVFGTVIHSANVSNIAREVALESALHPMTRSFSTIMACATSLAATAEAASWISRGSIPWAIAGGSESMSNFPVSFHQQMGYTLRDLQFSKTAPEKLKAVLSLRPKHLFPQVPAVAERLTGKSMGEHCEDMVQEWKIPREEQDKWAVMSHHRAAAHKDFHARFTTFEKDNLVRGDTTIEKAAKLKPAFRKNGSLTAANSSPLTDGAAAILLADVDYAREQGWPILAVIDDFESAAVDINKEGLLMAPPYAILRLLQRQNKKLSDFDMVEIHEAFAGQVLCNLKALQDEKWCQSRVGLRPTEIPSQDRINIQGGSIALGHPFAATGARLLMQLAQSLYDQKASSGLISICAAGGLGLVGTLRKAP